MRYNIVSTCNESNSQEARALGYVANNFLDQLAIILTNLGHNRIIEVILNASKRRSIKK